MKHLVLELSLLYLLVYLLMTWYNFSNAFDAPVDVGTIDWLADLALLGSLWELSNILWSLVKAWIVVIKPFFNYKIFINYFCNRSKTICCTRSSRNNFIIFCYILWFTPKTIVLSAFLHGAETITFFAPFFIWGNNFSFELNFPVHSKT